MVSSDDANDDTAMLIPCDLCQKEFLDTEILYHVEKEHSDDANAKAVMYIVNRMNWT